MSNIDTTDAKAGLRGLPQSVTSLVGRTQETEALLALLDRPDVRLVTLVGPGGVGKTRLAMHVAHAAAALFPDGATFVNLAASADPTLVSTVIGAALGLPDRGQVSCSEQLTAFVASKRTLLVLDNLEHLLPAVSLISELLAAAPGLTVLATSRVLLRVSGEQAFPVQPLSIPSVTAATTIEQLAANDAVQLFLDRAKSVRPSLELTDSTALAIARICQMLDGLPLAIELAAARANLLSPQAMAARLERRLPLLTSGARDRPLRQQTMRDAIAWSYDLLTAEEQALFRRLAVFVGEFSIEAAEAVTGMFDLPGIDVFEGIASLVDKSLLRPVDQDNESIRFVMLQTVREYALERLDAAGERATAEGVRADWYLALARRIQEDFYSPEEPRWMVRAEADRANFRAALGWYLENDPHGRFLELAGILGRFWYKWERFTEGRSWLDKAAAIAHNDPSSPAKAMILDNLGKLIGVQQNPHQASGFFAESLAIWREVGDMRSIARGTVTLADGYRLSEDIEHAIPLYEEGLALLAELEGESFWLSTALRGLATVELMRGNTDRAEQLFRESLDAARESGAAWALTTALHGVGSIASERGNHQESIRSFRESLVIAWELRDRVAVAMTMPALAGAMVAAGESERAAQVFGATAAVYDVLTPEAEGVPTILARHNLVISTLRTRLGTEAFDTAWAAGRERSVESAVELAITLAEQILASSLHRNAGERLRAELPGGLSEREAEVLRLAAAGLSNAAIADRLFLSPHTIRAHLQRIYTKLDIANRAEAVRYAVDHGLV
jgi:predicted ATPase/DNA-binding CsgD family transcriptional regulator